MKFYIAAFFLLTQIVVISQEDDEPACICLDYYHTKSISNAEILEFNVALKGFEVGAFMNSFIFDYRDDIDGKLKLNLNKNNHYTTEPQIAFAKDQDTSLISEILIQQLDKTNEQIRFVWGRKKIKLIDDTTSYNVLYALEEIETPLLTNLHVSDARVSVDPDNDDIVVSLLMTPLGAEKMEIISIKNIGNYIAIVSQNKVLSAPPINGPIRGGGIIIAGDFTKTEAEYYRNLLNCDSYSLAVGWEEFEKEMKLCD